MPRRCSLSLLVLMGLFAACLPQPSTSSEPEALFHAPANALQAVLSPAGDRVAYTTESPAGLWVASLGDPDAQPQPLAPLALDAEWSPGGRYLTYASAPGESTPGVISTLPPLRTLVEVTTGRRLDIGSGDLVWAPDDGRFAFHPAFSEQLQLWNPAGEWQLLLDSGVGLSPPSSRMAAAWAPDGSALVVSRLESPGGEVRLWRVNIHSGEMLALPALPLQETVVQLAWSPDGRWLAAAATPYDELITPDASGSRLWLINMVATVATEAASGLAPVTSLAWRPDGAQLAVLLQSGAGRTVWRLVVGEPELQLLLPTGDFPSQVRWPDASRIILDGGPGPIYAFEVP
jgi:WD40 repeat protein